MADFVSGITDELESIREETYLMVAANWQQPSEVRAALHHAINKAFGLGRKYQRGNGVELRHTPASPVPGKPTNEEVENAAKGIWSIVAFPDWQTWEGRIELERAHRGDGSYGDMTGTCRKYARVALEMARSAEGVADTVKEGNNDE